MVFPTCPSLQILGKTQTGVIPNSRFLVKSLVKENCHNSKPSDDIDMKLGPVSKLYKRNKITSKNFDDYVISENCDVIAIFSIYGQFGAIRKPDSGCIVCKTYIFTNSNILSYKNWKHCCFEWKYYFCQNMLIFCQKIADIGKIKRALVPKCVFPETKYLCVLTHQISSF